MFETKHLAVPSLAVTQEWLIPDEICVAAAKAPTALPGVVTLNAVDGSIPRTPLLLLPQHFTVPADCRTHTKRSVAVSLPIATPIEPESPATVVGVIGRLLTLGGR